MWPFGIHHCIIFTSRVDLSITIVGYLPAHAIFQDGHQVPVEVSLLYKTSTISGVVKLLDTYEQDTCFILVMERPEHVRDLFDYITEKGAVGEEVARDFFRQIVTTTQEVLRAGVLHRDIKDENILVDLQTGQLKLIDFGSGTFLRDGVYDELDGWCSFCKSVFSIGSGILTSVKFSYVKAFFATSTVNNVIWEEREFDDDVVTHHFSTALIDP